jgi:Ni,Fe-hydrogenase I small subunit
MEKSKRFTLKSHPDYDAVIDEVISLNYDEKIMAEAVKRSKTESQAEALYVMLKLQNS